MYNEIWKSVEALFKPLHRMADIITIPELTFELIGVLKINLKDAEYSDTSKYKRVIKQQLLNPEYQIVNIIFDYEDDDAKPMMIKMMYEGKLTLFNIIPYKYITIKNSLDGPIPLFMLTYLFKARSMLTSILDSPFMRSTGTSFITNTALHSIPLIFTRWMTVVFGMDKEVVEKIVTTLSSVGFPAYLTKEHINMYIDLLEHSTIEQLLDYGYIATEEVITTEAFLSYPITNKTADDEEENSNAEDISEA